LLFNQSLMLLFYFKMSQPYKLAQRITNNPLLTPVDGYSARINTDGEECEISFEFGGLKGIMEEMEKEDPMYYMKNYDDEDFSTKSSSPLGQIYLQEEKLKFKNIFLQSVVEDFQNEKSQNVYLKPNNSESPLFTVNPPVNFNFFSGNNFQQPIRRKKIKISQILKKKWKTKLPSFIDKQKTKLISKINLIKNQNINKYKNENELKLSMINYEENYVNFQEKATDRRSKFIFNLFLVSHPIQRNKDSCADFFRKPSKSSNLKNFSNKFNHAENSEFNTIMYLKNINSQHENKFSNYTHGSDLLMNHPLNKFNSISLDHFPNDINTKNFLIDKSFCKYS
jgi:hypothetical protein